MYAQLVVHKEQITSALLLLALAQKRAHVAIDLCGVLGFAFAFPFRFVLPLLFGAEVHRFLYVQTLDHTLVFVVLEERASAPGFALQHCCY